MPRQQVLVDQMFAQQRAQRLQRGGQQQPERAAPEMAMLPGGVFVMSLPMNSKIVTKPLALGWALMGVFRIYEIFNDFERLKREHEARKKKGDLNSYTINVTKTGQKKSTAYALLPDAPAPLPGIERVQTIKGDIAKYYAPPTVAEQQALLRGYSPEQQDE